MYAYITGKIQKIGTDYVIIENNNIGYQILTSNPYVFVVDEVVTVYTYLFIREDSHELFGFKTEAEKDLFTKLISVTGIGPKTACAILASGEVTNVINAIETGDVNYLRKFPKIGQKTAQQIILDLKGKLKMDEVYLVNKEQEDAYEALLALGYKDKEIEKVFKQITDKNISTQEYITKALQLMLK